MLKLGLYRPCAIALGKFQRQSGTALKNGTGISLTDKNIVDGEKVTVDQFSDRKHGQIVIAVVTNGYIIKQLYMRDGIFEWRPANPKFQTIRFKECDEVHVADHSKLSQFLQMLSPLIDPTWRMRSAMALRA